MNGLAFGFVFVALQALGGVSVLIQRNGMNRGAGAGGEQGKKGNAKPCISANRAAAELSDCFAEPDAMRKQDHWTPKNAKSSKVAAMRKDGNET
jgi:hypothetical protein